jgi:Na+-transporting methylmalonyl-CoA/oxaloacetate decarboxylase beta subunit
MLMPGNLLRDSGVVDRLSESSQNEIINVDTLLLGITIGSTMNGRRANPLIGASGISAFPMAGRLPARVAQEEDFENFLLMPAMSANAAGQVASVIAGGVLHALASAAGRYLPHERSRRGPCATMGMDTARRIAGL